MPLYLYRQLPSDPALFRESAYISYTPVDSMAYRHDEYSSKQGTHRKSLTGHDQAFRKNIAFFPTYKPMLSVNLSGFLVGLLFIHDFAG